MHLSILKKINIRYQQLSICMADQDMDNYEAKK